MLVLPWSLDSGFRPAPASGAAAGLVLLVGLALVGALYLRRGRDAVVPRGAGSAGWQPLSADDAGRVAFAAPGGVHPGEIGTVADEYVDSVDLAATVLDLAVRNYLWIADQPDGCRCGTVSRQPMQQ